MIALDEDALVCDFAETYNIYNMRGLSVEYAATLAVGLRHSSRIKLKQSGLSVELNSLLLAHIVDNTAINVYAKTKDAQTGRNKPKSILQSLMETYDPSKHARRFQTGADFEDEWRRLNG